MLWIYNSLVELELSNWDRLKNGYRNDKKNVWNEIKISWNIYYSESLLLVFFCGFIWNDYLFICYLLNFRKRKIELNDYYISNWLKDVLGLTILFKLELKIKGKLYYITYLCRFWLRYRV